MYKQHPPRRSRKILANAATLLCAGFAVMLLAIAMQSRPQAKNPVNNVPTLSTGSAVTSNPNQQGYRIEAPDIVSVNAIRIDGHGTSSVGEIAGEHLVDADGTINLGQFGKVYIQNMTVREASQTVADHLATTVGEFKVAVSVFAYNSKVCYVISRGSGTGDNVTRLPVTGRETVTTALSQSVGTTPTGNENIWIARAATGNTGQQILPVNWNQIAAGTSTATNYPLVAGDRIFVAKKSWWMRAADWLLSWW